MATRKINSFIQHLMTEAPMTTGSAGPPTEDAPRPFPGLHKQQNPNYTIPAPPRKPIFKPKPSPLDQSDRDGRTIPFFDVRIPGQRSGDVDDDRGDDFEYDPDNPGGMSDDLQNDIRPEDFSAPFGLDDDDRFGPLSLYYLKRPRGESMTPPDYPNVPTKPPPAKPPSRPGRPGRQDPIERPGGPVPGPRFK